MFFVDEEDSFYLPAMGSAAALPAPPFPPAPPADDGTEAADTPQARRERLVAYLAREGPVLWRTCMKTACIPVSRIGNLAQADYHDVPEGHPQSPWQAIESYLLIQTLSAINHHSIL